MIITSVLSVVGFAIMAIKLIEKAIKDNKHDKSQKMTPKEYKQEI